MEIVRCKTHFGSSGIGTGSVVISTACEIRQSIKCSEDFRICFTECEIISAYTLLGSVIGLLIGMSCNQNGNSRRCNCKGSGNSANRVIRIGLCFRIYRDCIRSDFLSLCTGDVINQCRTIFR